MRKILVVVFVLAFTAYAYAAQETKIGFINMQKTMNESNAGKEAKKTLEGLLAESQKKIDAKMAKGKKLKDELEQQGALLNDETRRQKIDELEKLARDAERLVADSTGDLQKKQRNIEMKIMQDIFDTIGVIGKEGNYTLILPADMILYSIEGTDITDLVIEKINQK